MEADIDNRSFGVDGDAKKSANTNLRNSSSAGGSTSSQLEEREDCWPDCVRHGRVVLDDVSRLNSTTVRRLLQARTKADVQAILRAAREEGVHVSVRGTKHSMGGHTVNEDGVVIDMQYVAHMQYHKEEDTVTVGTGAMWSDLIRYLNQFGKAPRTLQSYCSFSVGGTLSVNGHGITTDNCVAESVVKFTLIMADGKIVECSRDSTEHRELFGLCLGGYGLFGIIYDVTLRVSNNTKLSMEAMTIPLKEFPYVYESVLESEDVELKLARIDTTTFKTADLFVFRRASDIPTVSELGMKPKEMTTFSKLMYKWLAGPLREMRFALERDWGVALDWSATADRNQMLYESAAPLARLYSPLLKNDDTFILQEYFIPKKNFRNFVTDAKEVVLKRINQDGSLLTLLNITIRFVRQDTDTAIPYAGHKEGVYAFVLYFRMRRNEEADRQLQHYHNMFVELALREGGSFYLPYRHHYTDQQLHTAYPSFTKFCEMKMRYDPSHLFTNLWWERYNTQPQQQQQQQKQQEQADEVSVTSSHSSPVSSSSSAPSSSSSTTTSSSPSPFQVPIVSQHRSTSFRKLLSDPRLRLEFLEGFLVEIFSVLPNKEMFKMIVTAAWDSRNKNDDDIYAALLESVSKRMSPPVTQVTSLWSQISQLSQQKTELVRETVSIMARLGKVGHVHDYCSIGDHGKLILPLRKALGMSGKAWIVHDEEAGENDIPAVLERGALKMNEVGEFVNIDYSAIRPNGHEMLKIADQSCDLVTMNQGLHHLPQDKIMDFLAAVHRVLRPGGLFIVREHDLDEQSSLLPMLDCAHMVFNAATGVAVSAERDEIRGFRPLLQWREIVQAAGFADTLVYEMQPFDPTVDIMMCFVKNSTKEQTHIICSLIPKSHVTHGSHSVTCGSNNNNNSSNSSSSNGGSDVLSVGSGLLNRLPGLTLQVILSVIESLFKALPSLRNSLKELIHTLLPHNPALSKAAEVLVEHYINPLLVSLERFKPLTATAKPQLGNNAASSFIPEELYLLLPVLRAKANQGGLMESVIVSFADKVIEVFNKMMESTMKADKEKKGSTTGGTSGHSGSAGVVTEADITRELEELLVAIPELNNLEELVEDIGLPVNTIPFVQTAVQGGVTTKVKQYLVENLDKRAWTDLRAALRDVRKERRVPHMKLILEKGTAWNRAAVAILGSSKVQLSRVQSMGMSWAGLRDLVTLWANAQEERRQSEAKNPAHLSDSVVQNLSQSFEGLCATMECNSGSENVHGVLVVISATCTYESLTGLLSKQTFDVTEEVREVLDPVTGTLHLHNLEFKHVPLRLGRQRLHIKYRGVPKLYDSTQLANSNSTLRQVLADTGVIDGTAGTLNGPLTWYKLSEWMQVEVMQLFANSMEHTPWYRFPFGEVIRTYWDVLSKEVAIVANRHGWAHALASSGFITDLVPGAVMSLLFAQMSALSYPLHLVLGDDYDPATLVEQLVIAAPQGVAWSSVDPRITKVTEVVGGLWLLTVPTFKPFTEILLRLAEMVPSATILQISNQFVVQVKVAILDNNISNNTN